jgi:SHS2 domain-containing protein
MSRGDLQEMEVGTKQSRTAVNANAKAGDPMPKMTTGGQNASWEDLGGPTPENYRSDDDSAKLKTPGATLKQVRDVVNKGAKAADPMKGMKEDAEYDEDAELLEAKEEKEDEEEGSKKDQKEDKKEYGKKNPSKKEEDEKDMEESFQIEDDVNALLGGEELSEGFKEKAKIIFEAALKSKITEIKEAVEAQYEQRLIEEVEVIKEALSDRVDSYLEYVSEEWFVENELAIEHGLKTDLTESFLSGMKGLFEEHYVTIPEDRYDVLESMVEKLDDMETKLNEQIEKNISLNKRLAESVADGILDQVSEGLASTQKEKLASLAESVEFESEVEYREKLETLKESYFSANKTPKARTETLSEGVDHASESVSDTMAAYLRTLQAVAKN